MTASRTRTVPGTMRSLSPLPPDGGHRTAGGSDGPQPLTSSRQARQLLNHEGGPLFNNTWREVVFIHYECDPDTLAAQVPFELDLRGGRAFVSLVAFTLSKLRPFRPSLCWRIALAPMRTLAFLNLRTYVRHQSEPGVYFLAEWLPHHLPVVCGRHTFGLPYRFGRLDYERSADRFAGRVREGRYGPSLDFTARLDTDGPPAPSPPGTLDEFLVERYMALTQWGRRRRYFRIWHEPWPLTPAALDITSDELLRTTGSWFESARFTHAAYSPGLDEVWIGRPERITLPAKGD